MPAGVFDGFEYYHYIDATAGDDARDGLSTANAWKTLTRGNTSSVFLPDDSVLFKCGEVWREPLVVPASGAAGNPIAATFKAIHEDPSRLLYAAIILVATAVLLAAWVFFVHLNRYTDELEPKAMAEAKRENRKLNHIHLPVTPQQPDSITS